jgi:hypothetical protein
MRYIYNREDYKQINEGLFKNLIKKFKSKVAVELSKKLGGSAKKVDNLMSAYKSKIEGLLKEKNDKLKAVVELEMSKQDGGDVADDLKRAIVANEKSDKLYDQKRSVLKEKFDLEFNKIVKEENSEEVKHYIKIKKIELQEEMIQFEMNYIEQEMGIDQGKIESSEMLSKLVDSKKSQLAKVSQMKKDIDAKGLADVKSDSEDQKLKVGTKISYKRKNDTDGDGEYTGDPNDAEVMDKEPKKEGNIVVKTENSPSGVEINMAQVFKADGEDYPKKEEPKKESKEDSSNDESENNI